MNMDENKIDTELKNWVNIVTNVFGNEIDTSLINWDDVDKDIFEQKIIDAILKVKLTLKIDLHEAVEIVNKRFYYLNYNYKDKFNVETENYWRGFY